MKPALQFLELIVKKPENVFNMHIIREENRKSGMDPIYKHLRDFPTDAGNDVIVKLNGMTSESIFGTPISKKLYGNKNNKRVVRRKKTIKKRMI